MDQCSGSHHSKVKMSSKITPSDTYKWQNLKNQYIAAIAGISVLHSKVNGSINSFDFFSIFSKHNFHITRYCNKRNILYVCIKASQRSQIAFFHCREYEWLAITSTT